MLRRQSDCQPGARPERLLAGVGPDRSEHDRAGVCAPWRNRCVDYHEMRVITLLQRQRSERLVARRMIKTLQKHGNSRALVIDKALMEAIGIEDDSPLQISISGNSLIVTPVHAGVGREKVAEAIAKLRPRYGDMLKRLAE